MRKNYLFAGLGVLSAAVAAGVGAVVIRRARPELPPVSPTVPRIEEVRHSLAESTESQSS